MPLPFVQVRDLPPSASFYSSITQPLGLRFLTANASSIVFGDTSGNKEPIFEVKVIPANAGVPRPTRIVLSASSPSVVAAFHAAARRANPSGDSNILLREEDGLPSGESRASTTDLDGNMMQVVYSASQPSTRTSRVLDWNLDVATSVAPARYVAGSAAPSQAEMGMSMAPLEGAYSILRRSMTTSTVETSPQQQTSKGLSTGALIGTVLGAVAAGAAVGAGITYALNKNERNRASRQDTEAPPFQRRATYPEPFPDQRPRYVELERTVHRVHYPDQYPPTSSYPHMARSSQAGGPTVEEINDQASNYTSASRAHGRSTTNSPRQPLMLTDAEHRSSVGSQHPVSPPTLVEAEHRSQAGSRYTTAKSQVYTEVPDHRSHAGSRHHSKAHSKVYPQAPDHRSHVSSRSRHDGDHRSHASSRHRPAEVESYVSARSEKSASTVRPAKSSRSKAPSHYSSATVKPVGTVRSQAEWRDVDDTASVAPSDSISCVGERPSKCPLS